MFSLYKTLKFCGGIIINILTDYFKRELEKIGYGDLATDRLYWTLNHSQMDGIELPNEALSNENVIKLCERLMAGRSIGAIKRVLNKDAQFSAGGAYDVEVNYEEGIKYTSKEVEACEWFCAKISHDLKEVERKFCSFGYAFLGATPEEHNPNVMIDRNLGRFRLVVSNHHVQFYNFGMCYNGKFLDETFDLLESIACEGVKYFDMEISLYDLTKDDTSPIASSYLGECTLGVTDSFKKVYSESILERLNELVLEARGILGISNPKREKFFNDRKLDELEKIKNAEDKAEELLKQKVRNAELEEARAWFSGVSLNIGRRTAVC